MNQTNHLTPQFELIRREGSDRVFFVASGVQTAPVSLPSMSSVDDQW